MTKYTSKEIREALNISRTRLNQLKQSELIIGKDYTKKNDRDFIYNSSAIRKIIKRRVKNKKFNGHTVKT